MAHAEQLLFSCLCSKLSICDYVTGHRLHVTCLMSDAYVDPCDMLNNFCFHVYAQKSLFIGENDNVYFRTSGPYPVTLEFIELVPS